MGIVLIMQVVQKVIMEQCSPDQGVLIYTNPVLFRNVKTDVRHRHTVTENARRTMLHKAVGREQSGIFAYLRKNLPKDFLILF